MTTKLEWIGPMYGGDFKAGRYELVVRSPTHVEIVVRGENLRAESMDEAKAKAEAHHAQEPAREAAADLLTACKEALLVVDEAFEATGYIRVGKTSVQRLKLESAIMKAEGVTTTITDDQIRALRDSYAGGYGQMADVCTYALLGMLAARVMCEKALADPASPLR